MSGNPLGFRKKLGLSLLAVVLLYWIALPILPFLDIPQKTLVISVLAIGGELLTLLVIAILGKEYWAQIKQWCRQQFEWAVRKFKRGE